MYMCCGGGGGDKSLFYWCVRNGSALFTKRETRPIERQAYRHTETCFPSEICASCSVCVSPEFLFALK